jgi:threonine/homoserine/homoserine lactone efflux protein
MITFAVIFGGSFILALSGALMPGPLLTVTISESARRGFPAGPLLMTGHALPELLLVLAIIKGLGSYLRAPLVIGLIAFIGGIVLIWMGGGHGTNGRHPLWRRKVRRPLRVGDELYHILWIYWRQNCPVACC